MKIMVFISTLAFCISSLTLATQTIHHDISVEIAPSTSKLVVNDTMKFVSTKTLSFYLNKKLKVELSGKSLSLKTISTEGIYNYHIVISELDFSTLALKYEGVLNHKISGEFSPGNVSSDGVSLLSSTYWYPMVEDSLLTYDLKVKHPLTWSVASGGVEVFKDDRSSHWNTKVPLDDMYLISYPFKKYERNENGLHSAVYLRSSDEELAKKYLDFTSYYIDFFSKLIGEYPYEKFFVLENYWETGYGMPSFTLLGESVIRLPFLLYTSFPHEILHNWWGNSVYVDYEKGNWAEGLTTYMADHALQEQRGKGVKSRKSMIKSFMAYVKGENDFPLIEFKSRHDGATKAIGYNKSAMFFHMLKTQLGDDVFYLSLKEFYKRNIYKKASFDDLQRSFELVSNKDLSRVFNQWTKKKGQASINVSGASVQRNNDSFVTKFKLSQEGNYELYIPVLLKTEKNELRRTLKLGSSSNEYILESQSKPIELLVDSSFDVFRKLLKGETVASINESLSSKKDVVFVLPSKSKNYQAYKSFAEILKGRFTSNIEIVDDSKFEAKANQNIWVLGKANERISLVRKVLIGRDLTLENEGFSTKKAKYSFKENSIFLVGDHSNTKINFITAPDAAKIIRLASKITHYGSYSYLVFSDERNLEKETWKVLNSPFKIEL